MNRRTFSRAAGLAIAAVPVAAPAIASAQSATPSAQPSSSGLAGMMALAPAAYPWLDDADWLGDPEGLVISYADIATQLGVTGVTPPDTMDDAAYTSWAAATRSLAVPTIPRQYLSDWREDYGFDLFQADETLELSLAAFNLTLIRGRVDHDTIRATLTANGYRVVEIDGHELLTLRDDFHHDPTSDLAYKLAAMNHVALLDDGIIACSSVRAALVAVLDVATGSAPSMLEETGVAMLAEGTPADLVSGIVVSGAALAGDVQPEQTELEATPDFNWIATEVGEAGEMPPVVRVLLGATAGGPLLGQDIEAQESVPDARAVAVALMQSPEAAETAVPVVEERLATGASLNSGVPFSEYFPKHGVRAVPSAQVLVVEFALGPEVSPSILYDMLSRRDLGFLAW